MGVFRSRFLDPWQAGTPPFVCSDAMPADHLPVPVILRQRPVPPAQRKSLKRLRWLPRSAFATWRSDGAYDPATIPIRDFTVELRTQATLGRESDTTGDGDLYEREAQSHAGDLDLIIDADGAGIDLFHAMLERLAGQGFGADAGTGYGAFAIVGEPQPDADLATPHPDDDGVLILGTCQPAATDPVSGGWECLVKHGRLGPGLGVADVRKRPQVMLRPGACFHRDPTHRRFGRTIPDGDLLPITTATDLRGRGIHLIQAAITCTAPIHLGT